MNLPPNPWPHWSSNQRIIAVLAALCFVGLIALIVMALLVRERLQAGDPGIDLAAALPLEECRPLTLTLGESTFLIRTLSRGAAVPPDDSGIAYWVEGTESKPVFVFSPAPENLAAVSTISLGSEATATWSDCTFSNYRVYAHKTASFHGSSLPEQSAEEISVFFTINSSGAGFLFTARLAEEQGSVLNPPGSPAGSTPPPLAANTLSPAMESTLPPVGANTIPPSVENIVPTAAVDTAVPPSIENTSPAVAVNTAPAGEENPAPPPDGSEIQAEIGFQELTTSPDGNTITLEISIYNYGDSAFTLSANNISLTQPDGTALAMVSSEPSLPRQIAPAATETFLFTFPRPSSAIATLKIFTVEYDVEDY